ncbi:MAG: ferredoxin--NADP reductase [Terriglobia bacterium]
MTQTPHHARLRRVWGASRRVTHFEFELTNGSGFEFHSGQFISLRFEQGSKRYARPYSIATASGADSRFELCTSATSGDEASAWLQGLDVGDSIEFTGPYGFFRLRHPLGRVLAFIATGTGIAPIRAMLQELDRKHTPRETWLIFGVREESDILYQNEFENLNRRNPDFHFIPTLSRPGPNWEGHRGYVQEQIKRYLAGKKDLQAYICGKPEMVEEVRRLLQSLGYAAPAISYERLE